MVCVGDLARISEEYPKGVWLSGLSRGGMDPVVSHVLSGEVVIVLEIVEENVLVVGRSGVMGWTWMNRLEVL